MDQQLAGRRTAIERERARFDAGPGVPAVDPFVHESWQRCATALSPGLLAAPLDEDGLADRWDASPIRRLAPELEGELRSIAQAGDFVAAITDAQGRILWSHGGRTMRDEAAQVNFVVGGLWDESSAGTNAVGMALATGRPATVFSAEHWCEAVQDWVCYAAPVHDAAGRTVGAIDLSSLWDRTNPLGLPTVTAMARMVEQQLQLDLRRANAATSPPARPRGATGRSRGPGAERGSWRGAGLPRPTTLDLQVLGASRARIDGRSVLLTPRQVELLTILACAGGLTLDELHTRLHGDRPVSPTTTKVEVSRLRSALGDGVIGSRPYRLRVPVEVDVLRLLDRLDRGDLAGALRLYAGQLLPRSDAPFVTEQRHHCDVALRTAVLDVGTVADLLAYAKVHPFDLDVVQTAVERAGAGHPLLATATGRLAVARRELEA
jgi:hypothetical protein